MTVAAPEFLEKEAVQSWRDYFARVDALCSALTARQKRDIQMEVKAHLLESLVHSSGASEIDRLRAAMVRLGSPDAFVPGWVADSLLSDSIPGEGIRSLWQLLKWNARRGISRLLASLALGFGYFVAFYLFVMASLKPIFPENVGLITTGDGLTFLGYVDSTEMVDHLGYWLVPLGFGLSFFLIWFLGRMVGRLSRED
ncbi:MAG: hypothetical protein MPN21_08315 [Thermoanaerobaculia bacterium]|nr:hypothetical protein [Thermoanaerobaculia bacterium]